MLLSCAMSDNPASTRALMSRRAERHKRLAWSLCTALNEMAPIKLGTFLVGDPWAGELIQIPWPSSQWTTPTAP